MKIYINEEEVGAVKVHFYRPRTIPEWIASLFSWSRYSHVSLELANYGWDYHLTFSQPGMWWPVEHSQKGHPPDASIILIPPSIPSQEVLNDFEDRGYRIQVVGSLLAVVRRHLGLPSKPRPPISCVTAVCRLLELFGIKVNEVTPDDLYKKLGGPMASHPLRPH